MSGPVVQPAPRVGPHGRRAPTLLAHGHRAHVEVIPNSSRRDRIDHGPLVTGSNRAQRAFCAGNAWHPIEDAPCPRPSACQRAASHGPCPLSSEASSPVAQSHLQAAKLEAVADHLYTDAHEAWFAARSRYAMAGMVQAASVGSNRLDQATVHVLTVQNAPMRHMCNQTGDVERRVAFFLTVC